MAGKIKTGDTVMLKGSSPIMTAGKIEENGDVNCYWFGDDERTNVSTYVFPKAMLEIVDMNLNFDDDDDNDDDDPDKEDVPEEDSDENVIEFRSRIALR